jgi:hypothetical protein
MCLYESSEFGDSWLAWQRSLQLLDCLYRFLKKATLEIEVDLNAAVLIVEWGSLLRSFRRQRS